MYSYPKQLCRSTLWDRATLLLFAKCQRYNAYSVSDEPDFNIVSQFNATNNGLWWRFEVYEYFLVICMGIYYCLGLVVINRA